MNNFIKCGLAGWCMEVFWTGIMSTKKHDKKLMCRTSLWMFPIYGAASFLAPISKKLKKYNTVLRGTVYTFLIFTTEFITGSMLKKHQMCPWDYSGEKHNYRGIIRIDYAPVWFAVGLFFEKYNNIK